MREPAVGKRNIPRLKAMTQAIRELGTKRITMTTDAYQRALNKRIAELTNVYTAQRRRDLLPQNAICGSVSRGADIISPRGEITPRCPDTIDMFTDGMKTLEEADR